MLPGLRTERVAAGLTQEELAEASGVHRDTIVKLEAGDRPARPPTIKKLAAALGVETRKLTEKGRRQMDQEETRLVRVPCEYPDFKGRGYREWDDSREAWLWRELLRYRDRCMIETAAVMLWKMGEEANLPGVLGPLWGVGEVYAEEFIEDHRTLIESRAAEMAESGRDVELDAEST